MSWRNLSTAWFLGFVAAMTASLGAWAKDADPVTLKEGPSLSVATEGLFDVSTRTALKGIRRVVVPEFSVEFLQTNAASSSAGNTSVKAIWRLEGVGPAEYQLIVDAAYAHLLDALRGAGFEVVTGPALADHPAYAKMRAQGVPSGHQTGSGTAVAPTGMVVMPLGTVSKRSEGGVLGALQALSAVSSTLSGGFDTKELAQGLDATVLQLRVAVDFSKVEGEKGFLQKMSGRASVEGKPQPSIAAESTALRVFMPSMEATQFQLKRPLLLPEDAFLGAKEATSAGTTAGNVAGSLLRFAAGISGSSQTKEWVVTAEPEAFKRRISDGLAQFNAALVTQLAANR